MKGYLVNSETNYVELVDVGDWKDINRQIGSNVFTIGWTSEKGDTLYVDDNGLLTPGLRSFQVKGMIQPLFGKGLLLGTNSNGASIDPVMPYVEFINSISFEPQFEIQG